MPQVPHSRELTNDELPGLLNQFDAREVLHVTFGSVLAQFGGDIRAALVAHELDYYHALETHFVRHLTPFAHRA
jgi:hypothetical protein